MASSWLRVAAGLRLVAEHAARQAAASASAAAGPAATAAGALSSAASHRLCDAAASASAAFDASRSRRGADHHHDDGQDRADLGGDQEEDLIAPTTTRPPPERREPSPRAPQDPLQSSATPSTDRDGASIRANDRLDTGSRTEGRVVGEPAPPSYGPAHASTSPSSPDLPLSVPPPSPTSPSPTSPTAAAVEPVSSIPVLDQPREQLQHLKEGRPVPSTRIGRAAGFARLGLGLAWGAAAEGASRLLFSPKDVEGASGGLPSSASSPLSASSIVTTDANSDRLASTLCRMRGAALKMGQMLSIQDESLLPAGLQRALRQVRQGAEAMPRYQLERQMESQLGKHWRDRFERFDDLPFAAASIGQVHRAAVRANGSFGGRPRDVVVKVQYPGVARSIKSDLRNLSMLVTLTGMAPPGLFIENVIRVGEQELSVECDYRRELVNQRRVKGLVEADPVLRENRFAVPDAVPELSTDEILTSEYRPGGTIDKVSHLSQEERNRIGRTIMYLTMKELFVWRFMQTDPNWGNFLYDVGSGTTSLIDFGATREYSKSFVDGYLRIVWASANRDEAALMEQSYRMNFLTGEETEQMLRAHKLSGYTVGEPFYSNEPFDFRGSNISTRMGEHTSVFLRHRLTPPPEEVYTLHRKLAGAYMLCIKLGAVIECRSMLQDIVASHRFEDGLEPLLP